VSVVIVGVIRRKPVLTHASIVCEGMLASVNSVNSVNSHDGRVRYSHDDGRVRQFLGCCHSRRSGDIRVMTLLSVGEVQIQ